MIYSNSCSFGAPNQGHKIYPDVIANELRTTVVNAGIPGACNRRILRTSIRDILELQQKTNDKIIALIGLTFISRTELWQPELGSNCNDGEFHSISIDHQKLDWSGGLFTEHKNVHEFSRTAVKDYFKNWLLHFNPEAELNNLLTDIIMFTAFCKSKNVSYLIFSNVDTLPIIDFESPFTKPLYLEVCNDPNIVDLWNFSFGGWARQLGHTPKRSDLRGIHGHPNEQAHIDFGHYLHVNYTECYR